MTEPSLDILADLEPTMTGFPCAIQRMRNDRPELAEQWDKVTAARASGAFQTSDAKVAAWFTARDFKIGVNQVETHRRGLCSRCARKAAAILAALDAAEVKP